ncbi:MAG: hypothetical protein R3Y06_07665 [Faecalibacterium sp.]
MQLPSLSQLSRSRSSVNAFGGYQHTVACAENECYEAENLSARNYPALSPRLPRKWVANLAQPNGLFAKNGLLWVEGMALYYNAAEVGEVADSPKSFCGIGTKVLIWPDKLCFDTSTLTLSSLGAYWESVGDVSFTLSFEDGSDYVITSTGSEEPEEPTNGEFWLDTSGESDVLRVYSSATESWGAVETTYLKMSATGIGAAFAQYDTVAVNGVLSDVVGDVADTLNASLIVWDKGDDYLVVTGLLEANAIQSIEDGVITVEREIPDLDFIVQSDNRVWGCNSTENTLHACKLGDPTNWNNYMGTAADSYVVTVGSDGIFTGAAVSLGYVLFFKESLMHKVYGTKPENYQVTTIACRGVQEGSAHSLVTVNETLYYKATDAVMQYDGGLPSEVSEALGSTRYYSAVAGAAGGCYYIDMQTEEGEHSLFVYDLSNGLWQREDDAQMMDFVAVNQCLYALSASGDIWAIGAEESLSGTAEGSVRWSMETGDIGLYTSDYKTVSKLELRLEAESGASVLIEAQYDASGSWETLARFTAQRKQMVLLPVIPRRFDHMKLRISGKGDITLYNMTKLLEQGSELRWQT